MARTKRGKASERVPGGQGVADEVCVGHVTCDAAGDTRALALALAADQQRADTAKLPAKRYLGKVCSKGDCALAMGSCPPTEAAWLTGRAALTGPKLDDAGRQLLESSELSVSRAAGSSLGPAIEVIVGDLAVAAAHGLGVH